MKKELLARTLVKTGLGSVVSHTIGAWQGVVVFNYHRIGDPSQSLLDREVFSADQEAFDQQVAFLKRNFDVITPRDLASLENGKFGRAVMITFDDGYLDNYELAFPVLKQHSVPATFFIATGFVTDGGMTWWDEIAWMARTSPRDQMLLDPWFAEPLSLTDDSIDQTINQLLRKYKGLAQDEAELFLNTVAAESDSGRVPKHVADALWMNWDMIREMDQSGMEIGAHTVNHPVLSTCPVHVQKDEIVGSKQKIESELGHSIESFSYPVGQPDSYTEETKRILQEAGIRWAFTFSGGFYRPHTFDNLEFPRLAVEPRISFSLFRSTAQLPWLFA